MRMRERRMATAAASLFVMTAASAAPAGEDHVRAVLLYKNAQAVCDHAAMPGDYLMHRLTDRAIWLVDNRDHFDLGQPCGKQQNVAFCVYRGDGTIDHDTFYEDCTAGRRLNQPFPVNAGHKAKLVCRAKADYATVRVVPFTGDPAALKACPEPYTPIQEMVDKRLSHVIAIEIVP
jgi:hypothetical protein